jgi:hypothetical protein
VSSYYDTRISGRNSDLLYLLGKGKIYLKESPYVISHSDYYVSRKGPIQILLAEDIPSDLRLLSSLIETEPSIKGSVEVLDKRTLVFCQKKPFAW